MDVGYEQAARELLLGHLTSDGLRPKLSRKGVETGIGRIAIDFRIERIEPSGDVMRMVFWVSIDGVQGIEPSRFDLDLLGFGQDAHQALTDGVHVVLESVIPVLQADEDRRSLPSTVRTMELSSMTAGVPTAWDLFTGSPYVVGDDRQAVLAAIDDLALIQGIIDSITGSLGVIRPHWFKFFVVRTGKHELLGDMKVDGVPVGIVESFDSPKWPPGALSVRQFGLYRPAQRRPAAQHLDLLSGDEAVSSAGRRWRQRGR